MVFVGRDRVVWKRLLLWFVTFGISRRIWLHRVNKELDGHAALGINHRLNVILLCLPILGPLVVQGQTAKRINQNLRHPDVRFGPTWALALVGVVPLAGNGFFLGWVQARLNEYWATERVNPTHAIDIDVGLENDPKFLVAIEKARKESYQAGSRFDRRQRERQERWRHRIAHLETVGEERQKVRDEGGSTPVLPWKRPQPLEKRRLEVQCPCGHKFQHTTDWRDDVELKCPKCGRTETLPGLLDKAAD